MNNDKLCFMNVCDKKYASFIAPFVYFSSLFNENSVYEMILTEDISKEEIDNIMKVAGLLNVDLKLRTLKNGITPAKNRFLQEPIMFDDYDYAYIGDIDILILERISDFHIKQMQKFNECYDNVVRPMTKKLMSGLQFCSKEYFKKTQKARAKYSKLEISNKSMQDELILFNVVKESNLKIQYMKNAADFIANRPIHGIHISLNRAPFKINTMGFGCDKTFGRTFLNEIKTDRYIEASNFFTPFFKNVLSKIIPLVQKILA